MDLKQILEDNINYKIEKESTSQIGDLSGSNALLWDGYNFESEDSDHCPRIALLRRVGGIQEKKKISSFISNNHGRTFEDFLRRILTVNLKKNPYIEFLEEEEVEVTLEDDAGNILLTARPDKICRINDVLYPIEVKTIQSNLTAYHIFIKEKPKLGALIQLAIYMYGHKLKQGFLLYCASNWFSGYFGKLRWSVEPSFKIFDVEFKEDGYFYYNGTKSIVNVDKIIQGSYQFIKNKNNNTLPNIPLWLDINGDPHKDGCTYCKFKPICDTEINLKLDEFFNKAKEI